MSLKEYQFKVGDLILEDYPVMVEKAEYDKLNVEYEFLLKKATAMSKLISRIVSEALEKNKEMGQ